MAKSDPTKDPEFKRVLGNLLSARPKPHSEMKLSKRKDIPKKNGESRAIKARPKKKKGKR